MTFSSQKPSQSDFLALSNVLPYPRGLGGQLGELAHVVVIAQLVGQGAGPLRKIAQAGAAGIRRLAQDLGELRHHRRQLKARRGLIKPARKVRHVHVAVDLFGLVGVWVVPAQVNGGDAARRARL